MLDGVEKVLLYISLICLVGGVLGAVLGSLLFGAVGAGVGVVIGLVVFPAMTWMWSVLEDRFER